jgi:hypothetical protein
MSDSSQSRSTLAQRHSAVLANTIDRRTDGQTDRQTGRQAGRYRQTEGRALHHGSNLNAPNPRFPSTLSSSYMLRGL